MFKELLHNKKFVYLIVAIVAIVPFEIMSISGKHLPIFVEVILFGAIILIFGRGVLIKGFKNLFKLNLGSINLLMTIATIGAFYTGQFEEATIIIILFSLGEVLEDFGIDKSKSALAELVNKTPKQVNLKDGKTLLIADVKVDDVILVKHGEIVPLDCIVLLGTSLVDESSITGEPLPKTKVVGDMVYAGSIASEGYLELRVMKIQADSTLQKIADLTFQASSRKSNSQTFIAKFAKIYTPIILVLAFSLVVIPVVIFNQPFDKWFIEALTLLIISCPCALVISTPISIFSAVGNASKKGIVIKGGKYIEAMGKIRAIALDKTRTLTKGEPIVTDIIPFGNNTKEDVIECLAGLETFSEHPISKSITNYAEKNNLKLHEYKDFKAVSGKGAEGVCLVCTDSHRCVGTLQFITDKHKMPSQEVLDEAQILEREGKTVIFVSNGNEIKGIVGITDEIKLEAKQTIIDFIRLGVKPIMLTGDASAPAQFVASELGIKEVYSSLLPENKSEKIALLKDKYKIVAMIGDGVNDAPALALSDVGIGMGAVGSDVALENADIALMNDKVSLVPYLILLARNTNSIIRFNIILAVIIKLIFIILALSGKSNLVMAIIADVGVTIFVIINSLRLFNFRHQKI